MDSFIIKNKKLDRLITYSPSKTPAYNITISNLSTIHLNQKELNTLKMGLDCSFVDKNKHVQKNIVASMEMLQKQWTSILITKREKIFMNYYELTMILKLKTLNQRLSNVIIPGDKDSALVIMDKNDYVKKMQETIDKGIQEGVYAKAEDSTLQDLKRFQDFFYRNFSKYEKYDDMLPSSSQPAQLYGTAKTHKFDDINDVTVDSLKFRPITAQTGAYMYKTVQVISEYLKPLYENNSFIIKNTQDFAQLLREQTPLEENEEYISYDVESLFVNVLIHDTIKYILEEIFTHNKLPHICTIPTKIYETNFSVSVK